MSRKLLFKKSLSYSHDSSNIQADNSYRFSVYKEHPTSRYNIHDLTGFLNSIPFNPQSFLQTMMQNLDEKILGGRVVAQKVD